MNVKELENIIENEHESEWLDFKAKAYLKSDFRSFLADVMAMANSPHKGSKYIVCGVKDNIDGIKIITGIDSDTILDPATYTELAINNIEPDIRFDYRVYDYQEKKVGVFEILIANTSHI